MATHPSAKKRNRQIESKKNSNKYYTKSTRNAIKKLHGITNKEEAVELLPKITSMIDKLTKRKQIHKNKGDNLKSNLAKHVNSL
ncbi:MAG: 30S ribosomal protein S20 [Bacteroidales bacterium]|nr:30S ribosomal protein S20 [Bacteroidales bacterium]